MDLKVIGSKPVIYPIIKKNVIIKKESFLYEAYVWNYTVDMLNNISLSQIEKNSGFLGVYYSNTFNKLLQVQRIVTYKDNEISNIWNWYSLYYINLLFRKNLIEKYNTIFEKYNIISLNLKSKQIRLSIISSKNTIYNISAGRVTASLKITEKKKKKSSKGERLFVEYLTNFCKNNKHKFGLNKNAIFKIIGLKKKISIREAIFKILNRNFSVLKFIYDLKSPNNYFKFKKIRSIKRRLKKRIVKNENYIN